MSLTIHPLNMTRIVVETGRMRYLRDYGNAMWVACPFFAVLGGAEPVLVDTSGTAEEMSGLRLEPVEQFMTFEESLARVDLKPGDIGCVVQTHLMYDHCANSRQLPNARFVVQKKELDFARNPHPMFAGAYQRYLFEGLNFEIVEGDHDLMPGIRLLFTPGHSPGIQSVAVETDAGTAIITGFCCTAENFEPQVNQAWKTTVVPEVIPPGFHTDMVQAYDSMIRVRDMADIVIPFHDPKTAEKDKIPEID